MSKRILTGFVFFGGIFPSTNQMLGDKNGSTVVSSKFIYDNITHSLGISICFDENQPIFAKYT